MRIIHRDILDEIRRFYDTPDVLVVHGARQVGKTCLMRLMQDDLRAAGKETHYIDLEDALLLAVLDDGPDALIAYLEQSGVLSERKLNLFVDEIQYLANPSSFMKLLRDHHADRLKLIVSGSSSFEIKSKFRDSLAGRTVAFELLPLSFREFLRFRGSRIQLDRPVTAPPVVKQLIALFTEYVLYGGYPRVALEKEVRVKETYLSQVISTYIRKDIRDLANVRHVHKFNKLLEVLAAQSGQLLNVSELANTAGLSRPTVENYLFIMEQTYIIQLLRPFSRNIRSELFKTPKVFFHDTGVAHLLAMRGFPKAITGNMLENAVFAELRKARDVGEFFYWRTQDGKEIDFIVPKDEYVIPVEVKATASRLRRTALRYFQDRYRPPKVVCISLAQAQGASGDIEIRYPWEGIG
jgi:predicted AAA+ superfamily ATPase